MSILGKQAPDERIDYELTNIRNLMARLGNIQDKLSVIHVAGTNGKGSVCACIARILQEAGFRTGLYASPAVFDRLEIIKINDMQIPQQAYAKIMAVIQDVCAKMQADGLAHPTAFEMDTAAAFSYFYQEKCNFVVLEAGMGGAKDAVNIIAHPVCSVFTSISLDHMAYLGGTLWEIAEAKAGIIKSGCPCVSSRQAPEVLEVLSRTAADMGSRFVTAREDRIRGFTYDGWGSRFELEEEVYCPLAGAWQQENISCALAVVFLLQEEGVRIPAKAVRRGLSAVRLPGRFERIFTKPDIYIDGAHNEGAALALEETVKHCFADRKIVYIIGVLADKEYGKLLRILLPYAVRVFTVTPEHARALDGGKLAVEAGRIHPAVSFAPSVSKAVKEAADAAGADGVVLAFGSFSYLRDLRQAVKDVL